MPTTRSWNDWAPSSAAPPAESSRTITRSSSPGGGLGEQSSEIPLSVAAKLDSEHSSSDDPDEETLALLYEHPAMLAPAQLVPQIDQQSSV